MSRRRAILAAIMLAACVFGCGLGVMNVWYARGQEFVLPYARHVRIEGTTPARMTILYTLPHGQIMQHMQSHLEQRGWRRIALQARDTEEQPLIFVRRGAWGALREVVHVYPSAATYRGVEIQVGRCVKIWSYLQCL